MKLTKEQIKYGTRITMMGILLGEIRNHKYDKLQIFCETFNLSNEKVIKK